MTRVIVSGGVASIVMGMSGASLGALIFDTATIPFIVSASAGFVLGVWGFYRDAVRKSLRAVERFPQLLQLHLDGNFPHRGFDTWETGRFRSATFSKSWILQSMLIASWMTANRAIEVRMPAQYCPVPAEPSDRFPVGIMVASLTRAFLEQRIYEAEEERILLPFTAGAETLEAPLEKT
ncbi:hypothetical protein A1O7_02669 [Cladophialophora yegresii CBS 114405]|uniref:Uncharacterized protein n=1 Tax=Cladophialophora yegresii CBS 114405 TaxID=1182544 RepID=W9WCF0_9EURO|nr:uncharacterized protein A1O7_02669 [Cladophialophora yegresii CBS 114405]EXJ62236.1 hypothetical protein A1O7_02669 [Cladophialophora yegresii CBS 114405]